MPFFGHWSRVGLAVALFLAVAGCSPMESTPLDEEKEPHFVLGKSRVNAMDYDGAIRAFEESLETNPHSAQAHYQLAMLYETQEADPAAAIYHYQQYLKYDPKADNGEVILQRVASCKQQLAAAVLQLPSSPAAQQQLEKLTEENRRLHDQLNQYQAYLAAQSAAAKASPPAAPAPAAPSTNSSAPGSSPRPTPELGRTQAVAVATSPGTSPGNAGARPGASSNAATSAARPPATRTHTVARGETLASIARAQGISLAALEAANPSVNPRKLKAGQVLHLPAP